MGVKEITFEDGRCNGKVWRGGLVEMETMGI
jgi:hypothetical protein